MKLRFGILGFKPRKLFRRGSVGYRRLMAVVLWLRARPGGRRMLNLLVARAQFSPLLLADICRKAGDDHGAFQILLRAQRGATRHCKIHVKLAEIYRANGNVLAAHTHLRLAGRLKPGSDASRLLLFESEHHMFAEGSETLARILELPESMLTPQMKTVNQVATCYPEHAGKISAACETVRQTLLVESLRDSASLSKAVYEATCNRWLRLAIEMRDKSSHQLRPATAKLLSRLECDLGDNLHLVDIAWENEFSENLTALCDGQRVNLGLETVDPKQLVELFIPPAFFKNPETEMPTHGTIRKVFGIVLRHLMGRRDLVIVPRFQFNWRNCVSKAAGARIVSYHTHSPADSRHLHIQDSPLSGRCSFDHAGFAGFATIATDYKEIRRFVAAVSDETLERHHRAIYEQFVTRNVSKYPQAGAGESIGVPYVFIPLQVATDIVGTLAWMNGIDLLRSVVNHYRGSRVRVVVKRHPYCGSMKTQRCIEELEAAGDILRSNNSIHNLAANALAVITVNSGVGLEALIHSKTVIVSGLSDYSYAARNVKTPAELHQVLSGSLEPDIRRIREFLYYYPKRFVLSVDEPDTIHQYLDEWIGGDSPVTGENRLEAAGSPATD